MLMNTKEVVKSGEEIINMVDHTNFELKEGILFYINCNLEKKKLIFYQINPD